MKKRLFIGIEIPTDVKKEITASLQTLKDASENIKWVEEENYHFTLKFLGMVDEEKIEKINEALNNLAKKTSEFDLYLGKFDFLPEEKDARVIYIEVGGGEEAMNTAAFEVEEAMAGIGVNKEKREFVAHLTVGRIKKDKGLEKVKEDLRNLKGICHSVKVQEFVLFESELMYAGPTYQQVKRFKLKKSDLS